MTPRDTITALKKALEDIANPNRMYDSQAWTRDHMRDVARDALKAVGNVSTLDHPIYYKYPGDGFNEWTVIVEIYKDIFVGCTSVYPSGYLANATPAGGIYHANPAWEKMTLEEAVAYTKEN